MEAPEEQPQQPQDNPPLNSGLISSNILFVCNGIVSLLGWNAVLNAFDYFAYVY